MPQKMVAIYEETPGRYLIIEILPGSAPVTEIVTRRWGGKDGVKTVYTHLEIRELKPATPDRFIRVLSTCKLKDKAIQKCLRLSDSGKYLPGFKYFYPGKLKLKKEV
jgi:hypothetical protein